MELIRPETTADAAAIRRVHEAAFPTAAEADLVERLRASSKAVIALVAEDEGRIVGHILFSPVALEPLAGTVGLGLAPVAVLPDHEKHGVGRRLVQNGLSECRAWGAGFIVVLGEPEYYGRFGAPGPAFRESVLDQPPPHAVFFVVRQHGQRRESQPHRAGEWVEHHRAEQDMADDLAFIFRDQRNHGLVAGAQALDEIRFGGGGKCGLVDAPYRGSVFGRLGADQFHNGFRFERALPDSRFNRVPAASQ